MIVSLFLAITAVGLIIPLLEKILLLVRYNCSSIFGVMKKFVVSSIIRCYIRFKVSPNSFSLKVLFHT